MDILDALDVNGRSTFGWRNEDSNALLYCHNVTRIQHKIFDLESWQKEPYPNKAGNALDDDGEDSRENEISCAYVII